MGEEKRRGTFEERKITGVINREKRELEKREAMYLRHKAHQEKRIQYDASNPIRTLLMKELNR